MEKSFVERRKDARLPFENRILFSQGEKTTTAYADNISRGGIFVKHLDPFPLDVTGHLMFMLPDFEESLCVKAKVVHIVFDRKRCEIECGMGIQFVEMTENFKEIIHHHILNEERVYWELQRLLETPKPDSAEIEKYTRRITHLQGMDLLNLRYKVNRTCAILENPTDPALDDEEPQDLEEEGGEAPKKTVWAK